MVLEFDWRVSETRKNSACALLSDCVYTHASVLVGGKVIVQGGYNMGVGTLDIVYILDLTTKTWENIAGSRRRRNFHAILLVDDKIYIHGGGNEARMERWDIVTQETEDVVERCVGVSKGLTSRWSHTLEFYERKRALVMFGGVCNSNAVSTNGLLSYHVDSGIWKRLSATGEPPVSREKHASCMVGDRMYIYGGARIGHHNRNLCDLFVLNMLPRPSWSKLAEQHGVERYGASLCHIGGRLVVYGGRVSRLVPAPSALGVFKIVSEKPYIQNEEAVLNDAIESYLHHSAIVHGNKILIIGGLNTSSSTLPPLFSIPLLSVSW